MSQIDNILIQVRSQLQLLGIKLWLEPYYYEEVGSIESEIERLANEFSQELGISEENVKNALSELQDGAISKLQAKKEFERTGVATLKLKIVRPQGQSNFITLKSPLTVTGKEFQENIAKTINVDFNRIKIISSGKVIQSDLSLADQRVQTNQQMMVLIGPEVDNSSNNDSLIYNRVQKAKDDAKAILKSKEHQYFRMEDQDGNAIHLPPEEKNAIILALALYEKGRAALKREEYSEALVLFLEADEQFSSCNSRLLDIVDNYALLNLDIVWCYLCLKSFSQLPDAERRLKVCEQNFQKSYGQDMTRVIELKGSSENERALMMRLHLLQGILLFHQNKRNEAYEKLLLAENELKGLKVDDEVFLQLIEMGYGTAESRIALRCCNNNINQAITFIADRKQKKKKARKRNHEEAKINSQMTKIFSVNNKTDSTEVADGAVGGKSDWVNPRSLHTLVNMGFEKEVGFVALKMTENDIQSAINLIHNNAELLTSEMQNYTTVDNSLVDNLVQSGFDPEISRIALEYASNNHEQAAEILRRMQNEGDYTSLLNSLTNSSDSSATTLINNEPGPSSRESKPKKKKDEILIDVRNRIVREMEALEAYDRFSEDMSRDGDEYLDLPLIQEENILIEYKNLLEK